MNISSTTANGNISKETGQQPLHANEEGLSMFRLDDIRSLIRHLEQKDEEIELLKKMINSLTMRVGVLEKSALDSSNNKPSQQLELIQLSIEEDEQFHIKRSRCIPKTIESPLPITPFDKLKLNRKPDQGDETLISRSDKSSSNSKCESTNEPRNTKSATTSIKYTNIPCQYCSNGTSTRVCILCLEAFYCSLDCQRRHWSTQHSEQCTPKKSKEFIEHLKAQTYLPLHALPGDLFYTILSYLEDASICAVRGVNHHFKIAVDNNEIFWKIRFREIYGRLPDARILSENSNNNNDGGTWMKLYTSNVALSWDPYHKCDDVTLCNFNKTAVHSEEKNSWETVQIRRGIKSGKHYYELKTSGRLTLGIATREFPFNSAKNVGGENIISFGYASNGNYAQPNERWKVQAAERFNKEGDTIGMLVDLDAQILTFWRSGKRQRDLLPIDRRHHGMKWFVTVTLFDDEKTSVTLLDSKEPTSKEEAPPIERREEEIEEEEDDDDDFYDD